MSKFSSIAPLWAGDSTPSDTLLSKGASVLDDNELLSLLMGVDVIVARRLLESTGNSLVELARSTPAQLSRVEGVTASKAIRVVAALELGRREQSQRNQKQVKIIGSVDIISIFQPLLRSLPYEEVWILMLSASKNVIEKVRLSSGGTLNSPVDIKLVLKNAITYLASGVVLVHNHPSGDCAPSQYDVDITRRLKNALEIVDIKLLDHVVIGGEANFSFAERGFI